MTICLLALCSCATKTAMQDVPPRPERQLPTPEERKHAEGNPDILAKIGDLYAGPGWHSSKGLAVYRRALQLDPNHLRANLGAAIVYTTCGNPKKAIPHWQKVVKHAKHGTAELAHAEAMLEQLKKRTEQKNPFRLNVKH